MVADEPSAASDVRSSNEYFMVSVGGGREDMISVEVDKIGSKRDY